MHEAITNARLTHSNHAALTDHVLNAVVTEDSWGARIHKPTKWSKKRIDLAVAAVMAHSRAIHHANTRTRRRVVSW